MSLLNATGINNAQEADKILDYYIKHGIKNKSDFEKYKKAPNIRYKSFENKILDDRTKIKKLEITNDVSLMYENATPICKELANMGYFKYGKFKEIIKDKIYNKDFQLEATSPKNCAELKRRKKIIWNAYIKFAKRLISIYQ